VVYNDRKSEAGDEGMGKEEAKQKIADLVKKYETLSPTEVKSFNEAKTKQGFIDPLFRALGWNFEDTNEVAPEEKASGGRVDYAFKLNSVSIFFLEAKPLKADLTNEAYIKQAVTYAYNKGVTWALLTDFETLVVYVAQTGKPFITLTCNKYLDAFDDLWLLSKESFQSNSLAEKAERYGALPQRMGIEQRLFNQLRQWREELSTQLHSYNKHLSIKQIDEVIQRLFNRLIFIRTCEDRGIENKVLLSTVHEWVRTKRKGELIEKLRELFRYFDGYYDSELFQKHLTDEVDVESTTIENLINGLYEVPGGMASYDFSIIDADVLGAVYEQYLGHIANIVKQKAKAAQAKMDLGLPYDETIELTAKKQRRKEHGIYYTPKFITDYIVKETVGRFLAERSTNEIRNIKILDPACGSGSFLIRAFDELLKHYANQKISKSEQDIDAADRISILQGNIFGVDLDIQAVEIARLNLLLRSLAKRETLPTLADNIKQGNSLISGTEEDLKKYFGNSWKDKNAFNWEQEFKDTIGNGGFDVVIGNPPYVFTRGSHFTEQEKTYYRNYDSGKTGKLNLFSLFIEKGINLLKEGGLLGFIIPNNILRVTTYELLRLKIMNTCKIKSIVDLSSGVFNQVTASTIIMILERESKKNERDNNIISVAIEISDMSLSDYHINSILQNSFENNPSHVFNIYSDLKTYDLFKKVSLFSIKLGDISEFIIEGIVTKQGKKEFISNIKENESWRKFIEGKDIRPYYIDYKGKYIHYDRDLLHRARPEIVFNCPEKLICQRIGGGDRALTMAYDNEQYFCFASTNVIILKQGLKYNIKYVLGILNSKLMNYYYIINYCNKSELTVNVSKTYLSELPIRKINFNKPKEKTRHDTLVALVEKMLELNKKLAPIKNDPFSERDELKKEIEKTDKEIDTLVYDLYGLTEEDRKIVEGI